MGAIRKNLTGHLLGGLVVLLLAAGASAPPPATAESPAIPLGAKYPGDVGLAADPDVIFFDNFESWPSPTQFPEGLWTSMKGKKKSRTHVIPGTAETSAGKVPGGHILEIACWLIKDQSTVGGLVRLLGDYNHKNEGHGPGYDEVYVRYYMRLSDNYQGVGNHGSNLGGRDASQPDARWVGMSNTRDVAKNGYFFSGLQPYGKGENLSLGFYIYDCDKKTPWGDERHKGGAIKPGQWYCVERHMKLNSAPDKKDGCEQLWLDGKLVIDVQNLRFRKVDRLKINYFSLETYYHGEKEENSRLPAEYTPENPIAVQYDDLVIAKRYIGPVVRPAGH
jgi:hypothetical protein